METLTFLLFMAGKIGIMAIMTFCMAIFSGAGLGLGLHFSKKFLLKKPKPAKERLEELEELLGQSVAKDGQAIPEA